MANLPSGTVTFLFTDIEGSTKLAREHPETWETLRARHHAILQSAMDAHNGYVFQIIGDAFCVAFHTASDGLNAAIDAQRALQTSEVSKTSEVLIRVRMGIHTGEAKAQDNEYHGYLTMSLLQRIMSAGHGGQILLSNATENLLRGQLPKDVTLRDMGEHKFKDVIQPVRVFQVAAAGLQSDFPALRALDVFPNNLPTQLTSFVGREKELADVKKLLQDAHILTLIGPGGTGKTRLSIQSADESLNQYRDGVWLIELAPILDPLLVPRTTAIAIGLREEPQRPVIDMLCDYLREKKILIILDNCEHLVDACAQMASKILQAAPHVRILASSREALGIAGEVTYRVPSLGLPDMNHLPSVESLSQYEAVKLFIDRATSAVPNFKVTNDNAPFLAQICHRLDGIPLAIELAAAKFRVLNLEQIAKRLDDRFRLLTGGSRTALERHQTLRAAIDWSYNLLPLNEQVLFRRLSVFVGGWTLEAAESVCGDEATTGGVGSDDILILLEQLINKSLVNKDEVNPEPRYRILESIRQYAMEKLAESSESGKFRDRHLAYFLNLAESAESQIRSTNQLAWLNRISIDNENLRTALSWSFDQNQEQSFTRLGDALGGYWTVRGNTNEANEWLEKILQAATDKTNISYIGCLYRSGMTNLSMGKMGEARSLLQASLDLYQRAGNERKILWALNGLGLTAREEGKYAEAEEFFERCIALHRSSPSLKEDLTGAYSNLGLMKYLKGEFAQARALYETELSICQKSGDKRASAVSLSNLGLVALAEGSFSQAIEFNEAALKTCRELGTRRELVTTLINLAIMRAQMNEASLARELLEEALTISIDMNARWTTLYALAGFSNVLRLEGASAKAAKLQGAVSRHFEESKTIMENPDKDAFDATSRALIELMGDAVYQSAFSEGKSMNLESSIGFVFGD